MGELIKNSDKKPNGTQVGNGTVEGSDVVITDPKSGAKFSIPAGKDPKSWDAMYKVVKILANRGKKKRIKI